MTKLQMNIPITMMQKFRVHRLSILFIAVLMVTTACVALNGHEEKSGKKDETIEELADYRSWTLVNPHRHQVLSRLMLLCTMPTEEQRKMEESNPHNFSYISVYVNDIGTKAMMEEAQPEFPVGTVIVKEKYPDSVSTVPEAMTVMVKRAEGYYPDLGDWEFMLVDGTAHQVAERGRIERCASCHRSAEYNDFVFRAYLPPDVRRRIYEPGH